MLTEQLVVGKEEKLNQTDVCETGGDSNVGLPVTVDQKGNESATT